MDVGTVQAYWEAKHAAWVHAPPLDLYDETGDPHQERGAAPAKIQAGAVVKRSLIGPRLRDRGYGGQLRPIAWVYVGPGSLVRDSVLYDTRVQPGATVVRAITDKQVVFASGCRVGSDTDLTINEAFPDAINTGLTLLGKNTRLPAGLVVGGNCVIGSDLVESDFAGLHQIASGKSFRVQPI